MPGKAEYKFRQSRIWEGGTDRGDPTMPVVTIRSKSEEAARKKLPKSDMGRHWIRQS